MGEPGRPEGKGVGEEEIGTMVGNALVGIRDGEVVGMGVGNAEGPAEVGFIDGLDELGRYVGTIVGSLEGANGSIVGDDVGARVGT